jgi:cyclic pyranopterin phosphate synthase
MPFDGNKWEWNKVITADEIVQHIKLMGSISPITDDINSTSRNYTINGHKGTFGVISTMTEPFCSTCNRLRLTSDGKLKNCLFSNDETDILTAFRKGEDIIPLINDCLLKKKKERAGIFDFEHANNRAMIAIGG